MMWLALSAVALVVLAPLALALLRPPRSRGRAEADLALYRAQLEELDVQRDEGRLDLAAHRAATLEVQRRVLAAPKPEELPKPSRATALIVAATVVLVPGLGIPLYLWRGIPEMPSVTGEQRRAAVAQDDALIAQLRERLQRADPATEMGRQGWIMLGNAERNRGRWAEAVEAWERALSGRFDATLAAELAEVHIELRNTERARELISRGLAQQPGNPQLRFLAGLAEARDGRNENARAAWRALLADAPRDAPWREVVEGRLRALP